MLRSCLITLLATLALPALAENVDQLKTCHLEGRLRLQTALQIYCDGDMVVEDGAEIITDGHEVQVWVAGKAYFGNSRGFSHPLL